MVEQTNINKWTALADKARRCFTIAFDGYITIHCITNDRSVSKAFDQSTPTLKIDGFPSPPTISIIEKNNMPAQEKERHCNWYASEMTLQRVFDGGHHLSNAYMSGRILISGDMAVMARLSLHSSR